MNDYFMDASFRSMRNDDDLDRSNFDNDDVENKSPNPRVDPNDGNSQSSGSESSDSDSESDSSTTGVSSGTKGRLEISKVPNKLPRKAHNAPAAMLPYKQASTKTLANCRILLR
jgi:hypothetical protein